MSGSFRCVVLCVFFFKQKTAYEVRISDWSSDVCSSDLGAADAGDQDVVGLVERRRFRRRQPGETGLHVLGARALARRDARPLDPAAMHGDEADRKSVV